MAVRTREEIMNLIQERIGDDTSDSALAMIEDITDTLDDYEARIAGAGDWRARYEQNDAEWRQRYKERFFGAADDPMPEPDEVEKPAEDEKPKTFDDLFE